MQFIFEIMEEIEPAGSLNFCPTGTASLWSSDEDESFVGHHGVSQDHSSPEAGLFGAHIPGFQLAQVDGHGA